MDRDRRIGTPHPWTRGLVLTWGALLGVHTLLVLIQAVLAGQLLSGNGPLLTAHRVIGEQGLMLVALAMLVAAILLVRPVRGPWWPAAGSLLLLLADGAQLGFGFSGRLSVHVPLGVAIFGVSAILIPFMLRLLPGTAATRAT